MSWSKRRFLCALVCAPLAGCGFRLRGSAELPFEVLYIDAPPTSIFATQLRRVISGGTRTRVTNNPAEADAILQLVAEIREKEILALSAGGRVREFQLRYRLTYAVFDREKKLISPQRDIVMRRDFSFNDQDQLSKESEEALLYRDMQNDAVQQLVRRLQAVGRTAKS